MNQMNENLQESSYVVWNPSDENGAVRFASCDFRDGQQSLIATRMRTEDMIPILEEMDAFGFECIEMWGGATFDSCIRYLDEDPWDRVRTFKKYVRKTPLRMLLRGQNLLGYTPYPDDVVEQFILTSAKAGIDIFLTFDGLNDIRNCETAARAALKAGKRVEGNIQFTSSPVHTMESFVQTACDYISIGATAVHLEDMGGMIDPITAAQTVAAIKKTVNVPVHYHAHCTSGMTEITYWEVIKAGADVVDVDVSAFALSTSHPSAESIIAALKNTPRDTKLDYNKLANINRHLLEVRKKYREFEPNLLGVDINVVKHQIPGGMRSNLERQLSEIDALNRLEEVLEEVVRVRKDFGYPPLGTPFSQMCGAQATMNVITGERYRMIPKETQAYVRGKYGRIPGPVNEELKRKVLKDGEDPIDCRPADLIEPGMGRLKKEIAGIARNDEDVLTYALFPTIGLKFLERKYK
ncbi:MAG: pyruvate carboxylase subunit B [Clostridiales bacterium]|jgi:pyruvate carboxylase subunit B|nr:pyruvate carboxylase subunit B [Clostridiales bacterium]